MKNNDSLYFDNWRKRYFKKLIKAYTKVAELHPTKDAMRENFGDFLDRYVDSRGSYTGTPKQWHTAYILGRELGVFYRDNGQSGYELSPLAKATLTSQITLEQYLLIYLLNLNQLINGTVVHPLKEVLDFISVNETLTKEDIIKIPAFNLLATPREDPFQLSRIFLHRLVESEILVKTNNTSYQLGIKYTLEDLYNSINEYSGSAKEFENLEHSKNVEMLSQPVNLVPQYYI